MSGSDLSVALTVKDVYDFAYEIAEDFDKLVNLHGLDLTRSLIHKVINVLESLETSVQKIECLEKEIVELKSKLTHLVSEKASNDFNRERLKMTFEETEEVWNKECQNLKAIISILSSENKLLKIQATAKEDKNVKLDISEASESEKSEIVLKLMADLQRKDKQLSEISDYNDVLKMELEQVLQLNKVLQLSHNQVKIDVKKLKFEKVDYESKLDFLQQKIANLEQALEERASQECEKKEFYESLMKENITMKQLKTNCVEMDLIINERNYMLEKIETLNSELQIARAEVEKYENNLKVSSLNDQSTEASNIRKLFRLFLEFPATIPVSCLA
ncbi:JNK-interacting protein 3-like [Uloborus diversus]|uniref:JNK-interacting protein 3-like n=1 Tax=Uloborus diversus TaxID=327109 RepID=UPI00240A7B2C|nr:JNK-interacting protein 3-like [Uloborus diversus]